MKQIVSVSECQVPIFTIATRLRCDGGIFSNLLRIYVEYACERILTTKPCFRKETARCRYHFDVIVCVAVQKGVSRAGGYDTQA